MRIKKIKTSVIAAAIITAAITIFTTSCQGDETNYAPAVTNRDTVAVLTTYGVSTVISDSGIIRYKIIAEEWSVYDKTDPPHWSFEKGLFLEKFNQDYQVDAFITCDTAYYYDTKRLWELRSRVVVKNLKGETFKTSLLFWDQNTHQIYSDRYMEINGEQDRLTGYNFKSNEQMTNYIIHSSSGNFPLSDKGEEIPTPPDSIVDDANANQQAEGNAEITEKKEDKKKD